MAFTVIPNSLIDADSPLDATLFTYLRDNDDYLNGRIDWTGNTKFHATTGHKHTGAADDAPMLSVSDGSITIPKGETGVFNLGLLNSEQFSTTNTSYEDVSYFLLYIPPSAANLIYSMELLSDVNCSVQARLRSSAANGSELNTDADSWTWFVGGALDVSSFSGWNGFYIQLKRTGVAGTAYVKRITANFT